MIIGCPAGDTRSHQASEQGWPRSSFDPDLDQRSCYSGLGHAYGCLNRFGRHRPAGELENEFPVGDLVPLESELDGVCKLTRVELGVPSRSALRR